MSIPLLKFLLLLLPLISPQSPEELYENTPKIITQTKDQFLPFIFQVSKDFTSNTFKDVIIYGMPTPPATPSILEIWISTTPINASDPNGYQLKCTKLLEMTPCVFSFKTVPDPDLDLIPLYFGVFCQSSNCSYSLKIYHISPVYLEFRKPEMFQALRESGEIFNFSIPAKSEFDRIIFQMNLKREVPQTNGTKVFFSKGDPSIFRSENALLAIFTNKDPSLCFSCNVTVFLSLERGLLVELEVFKYDIQTSLALSEDYYDFTSSQNLYNISISSSTFKDSCLLFSLRSLSGSEKTLYVNPGSLPNKTLAFLYNSSNPEQLFEYENDIEICEKDLQTPQNVFFLQVKQSFEATSPFIIRVSSVKDQKTTIKLGVSEKASLNPNQFKYFQLEVYPTESSEGKLLLFLHKYGNNITLYTRICPTPCLLITEEDARNKNSIALYDERIQDTALEFRPKCVESAKCYYLFAIKSGSKPGFFSFFLQKQTAFIELMENRRHESYIEADGRQMYRISLYNDLRNIERVSFLVSSDIEYKVYEANETGGVNLTAKTRLGNERYPVVLDKTELNFGFSHMFIEVTSEKSGSYWVLAEIERGTQDNSNFFLHINEGSLFYGVLNKNFPELYLKYDCNKQSPVEIDLVMTNEVGKLGVFVSESPDIPTQDHYLIKGEGGLITFTKSESGIKKYNILIRPRKDIDLSVNEESISFDLTVSTNETLRIIQKGGVLMERLEFNQTKQFLIVITQDINEITFALTIPENSKKGMNFNVRACDNETVLVKAWFRYSDTGSIFLKKAIIDKLCENIHDYRKCEFFVEITSNEVEAMIFSMNVIFQAFSIEIKNSIEQKIPIFSTGTQFLRLFYHIHNKSQPVEVSLRSYYPDFQVYVSLFDDRTGLFRTNGDIFPNNSSNLLHSQYGKSHYMRVSDRDISDKCWPRCVLLLAIQANPAQPIKTPNESPSVNILIGGQSIELPSDGKPRAFSITNNEFRYCFLPIESLLKGAPLQKNGSISFSLSHFIGEGGIYFKLSDKDQMPFPNDFDYFSYDGHITLYFKDLERTITNNKMDVHTVKIWLALFCRSQDCEFALTSHRSFYDYQIMFLDSSLEVTMVNQPQVTRYFRFKNTASKGFKVKFNRVSGVGRLSFGFCPPNESFFEIKNCFNKPTEKNDRNTVFFAGLGESHLTVRNTDPDYCDFCEVAIGLECLGDLKGSLSVVDIEDFSYLQEGKSYYDSVEGFEVNRYRIMVSKSRDTTIKVMKFSGNVEVYFNSFYEKETKKYKTKLGYDPTGVMIHTIPAELSPTNKGYEVLKPVFIVVTSSGPANYSITFTTSQMLAVLNYGLLEKTVLTPTNGKGYFFQAFDRNLDKTLTLMVSNPKNLLISFRYRAFDGNAFISIALTEQITTENSFLFSLPREKVGTYALDLKNIDTSHNNTISIILNSIDAVLLPLNHTIHGVLDYKSYKYYEVFLESPGYLVLDFKECTGSFELAYTKEYKNLFLHSFDGTFAPVTRNSGVSRLKVDPGMLYFAVLSLEKTQPSSLFELTALYYDGFFEIPQSQMIPGEEGRLTIGVRGKEKHTVSFWPVKCIEFCEDEEMKAAQVEYIVITSEKHGANKCGNEKTLGQNVRTESLWDSSQANKQIDFEVKTKKGSMFVSLRAVVKHYKNSSRDFSIYYQEIDLSLGGGVGKTPNPDNFYFFLGCFGGLMGLVCCFCGMQYWRKLLKGEHTLTYEMQDVRNVVQIRGVNDTMTSDGGVEIENPGKSYVGLVEE